MSKAGEPSRRASGAAAERGAEQEGTRLLRALSAAEKVRLIAAAAEGKKARDLVVLDMRPVSLVADSFVICSGGSRTQVQAIADAVEEALLEAGVRPRAREGFKEARWVCLDFGDVVVHVFQEEDRAYYDLERLWGDAPRLLDAVGGHAV